MDVVSSDAVHPLHPNLPLPRASEDFLQDEQTTRTEVGWPRAFERARRHLRDPQLQPLRSPKSKADHSPALGT